MRQTTPASRNFSVVSVMVHSLICCARMGWDALVTRCILWRCSHTSCAIITGNVTEKQLLLTLEVAETNRMVYRVSVCENCVTLAIVKMLLMFLPYALLLASYSQSVTNIN